MDTGSVISSIRHEMDPNTKEIISRTYYSLRNHNFNISRNDKIHLNYQRFKGNAVNINCIRIVDNDYIPHSKPVLNLPTMIRCQNCETNFPTKYQYQRHQCEFNAEKVVLKPEVDVKEVDKSGRIKYVCQICERQFVSRTNLERHESSHEKNEENICEHCNKKFVSENRLRIHKENHCKKAGDISKFYRSDVTVWKCKKCDEVFSSVLIANYHVLNCNEIDEIDPNTSEDSDDVKSLQEEMKNSNSVSEDDSTKDKITNNDNKFIDRILTEILFQCEFCNRTYADKKYLLLHQRKHTTSKNYECSNCFTVFDSYATAVQHWLKKCTEYVNVFFLPRLTYCEYCDRPFKSHELLYTHKIKKKHYTSKIHLAAETGERESSKLQQLADKSIDNKEILNQLIEDVLKTLDVPINKIKNFCHFENKENQINGIEKEQHNVQLNMVKYENFENSQETRSKEDETGEKKKRGRKRKWLQRSPIVRTKKPYGSLVEKGFKYQCERCVRVFAVIADLDAHRDKDHASNFSCEECGQV